MKAHIDLPDDVLREVAGDEVERLRKENRSLRGKLSAAKAKVKRADKIIAWRERMTGHILKLGLECQDEEWWE